ncbi:MAG: NAD(P)-binding protein [Gemmataceae bacterium]
MPIRVSNLHLSLDEPLSALSSRIAEVLGIDSTGLSCRVVRKSLDTRDKRDVHFVLSAEVRVPGDESAIVGHASRRSGATVELYNEQSFSLPEPGTRPLAQRPVVVGSGPGGLVAAYFLAERGYAPLVLERGPAVDRRIRDVKAFDSGGSFDPQSNYLFGEGGAGTFSDGKLTSRGSGPDVHRVLELFAECKGKPSILYDHRPHLGSNRLPAVVKAIRRRIESLGGEVRFNCQVEDIDTRDGQLRGLHSSGGYIAADVALLAIGHSARDTYTMLVARGVPMEPKPFQFGVRIEHPQDVVNRAQYGREPLEELLGNADYSLVAKGKNDLFTFCMCAGGYIIPSVSQAGYFCTNGMSLSRRDSYFANSGLVVTVPIEAFEGRDVLAGVRLQERYERRAFEIGREEYRCPVQMAQDYLANRVSTRLPESSYPRGVVSADLREVLPSLVAEAVAEGLPKMDRRWHGRFLRDALLAGPEARGSSPVRIVRDSETRASPGIDGLYPVGEGAGYAGGIVSAAVDGLRTARAVIQTYARPG